MDGKSGETGPAGETGPPGPAGLTGPPGKIVSKYSGNTSSGKNLQAYSLMGKLTGFFVKFFIFQEGTKPKRQIRKEHTKLGKVYLYITYKHE